MLHFGEGIYKALSFTVLSESFSAYKTIEKKSRFCTETKFTPKPSSTLNTCSVVQTVWKLQRKTLPNNLIFQKRPSRCLGFYVANSHSLLSGRNIKGGHFLILSTANASQRTSRMQMPLVVVVLSQIQYKVSMILDFSEIKCMLLLKTFSAYKQNERTFSQ